ncbi:hypothetical protein OQA88_5496 [Cercophora sp. LCS_1]
MASTGFSGQLSADVPRSPDRCVESETPSLFDQEHGAHTTDARVDSGYASLTGTPATDGSSGASSGRVKRFANEGGEAGRCARVLFSPRPDLTCFEKPLDDTTFQWFEDTGPRIEQLLVDFLRSGRHHLPSKYKPIAVRLMVLGHNESNAHPYIVALVPSKAKRKVDKFFVREDVKELLTVPGGGHVSMPVVVAAHTTSFLMCRISDIEVRCSQERSSQDQSARHTLCGLPIMVNSRRLTLGGIIRVRPPGGSGISDWKFYGISAGHFDDEDTGMQSDSDDESELEFAGDDQDDPMQSPPQVRPLIPLAITPATRSWDWESDMTLGHVVELNDTPDPTKPDLDWCLIDMGFLLPNVLDSQGYQKADVVAPLGPGTTPIRNVVVSSGARGLQSGKLHMGPTRVLLGRSETFMSTYILKLESGTIEEGDSGSWVLDPVTFEVLGHVAAKDLFGDIYVIPMVETLKDIQYRLGCVEVGLPSALDIFAAVHALPQIKVPPPPQPPKTPPPQDSGYATKAQCTPQAPSTEEIHAVIRSTIPQKHSARPSTGPDTYETLGWADDTGVDGCRW